MSLTPLTVKLAGVTPPAEINHWFVGIGIFVFLLILMGGLLIFGAGRDHS